MEAVHSQPAAFGGGDALGAPQEATTTTPNNAYLQDTRTHVVGELYDTERSYVESLQILIEKYMKPLKSSESNNKASLIELALVDEIFYTIPEILTHHENFLSALQARLSSDWDSSQVIGNVFIDVFTNQQIIDTYTAFINNWKNARQAIKLAIQAKPSFERFLEAMSREHKNKLTLDALLIMPVQRIPRYELLIKELIKHTPEDHPDHWPLIEAQRKIHELALKIDRAEKEMMHQERLKDLESLIEGHVELAHQQRDFLRYDLVSISSSSSSLAPNKKERVLFLFCDLLIITSVKKKVSRRSNLQAAFANSTNDISLLEGNKFKLILRVALDQVEIRHQPQAVNDLIIQQQQLEQQQQQQQQLNQAHEQQKQRKRILELESDLCLLQQMKSLANQLASGERECKALSSNIDQLMHELDAKLNDCHAAEDLYLIQAASRLSANQQPVINHSLITQQLKQTTTPQQTSPSTGSPAPEQSQSSDQHLAGNSNSLELIISTGQVLTPNNLTTATDSTTSQANSETGSQLPTFSLASSNNNNTQNSSEQQETLIVTFASRDRRQAFLQSFLEAKQQRFQQHQQRIFTSSLTLKLSCPHPVVSETLIKSQSIASDMRRNRLRHQDELTQLDIQQHDDQRNASAPCGIGASGQTIKHQMSAPQSLAVTRECGQQACNEPVHHHHHHQLMRQPASQPLQTICCHDQHLSLNHPLHAHTTQRTTDADPSPASLRLFELAPKFIASLPINFLNTQHPALQLTCSVGHHQSSTRKCQTIGDQRGQLWMCMSNGYVSHVALIKFSVGAASAAAATTTTTTRNEEEKPMVLVPIVCSSGDICKSQITCAVQVVSSRISCTVASSVWKREEQIMQRQACSSGDVTFTLGTPEAETEAPERSDKSIAQPPPPLPPPTVSIKAASPPVNIVPGARDSRRAEQNISSSAPASRAPLVVSGVGGGGSQIVHDNAHRRGLHAGSCGPHHHASHEQLKCRAHQQQQQQLSRSFTPPCTAPACRRNISTTSLHSTHGKLATSQLGHHHHHHHHHHNHHHSHHHVVPHSQQTHHHHHHVYHNKHHTVPLAELRRSFGRQLKLTAAPETSPPSPPPPLATGSEQVDRRKLTVPGDLLVGVREPLKLSKRSASHESNKKARSTTPPARYTGSDSAAALWSPHKSVRSARLLRHQASLKTSSILAKLVGTASRGSSYLRKSASSSQPATQDDTANSSLSLNDNNNSSTSISATNSLQIQLKSPQQQQQAPIVSPLSSVSSLNSTNTTSSSLTVNSVCASSRDSSTCNLIQAPGVDNCELVNCEHRMQTTANCTLPVRHSFNESCQQQQQQQIFRNRSATVPCRAYCDQVLAQLQSVATTVAPPSDESDAYKVSDIIQDDDNNNDQQQQQQQQQPDKARISLWMGCDDGSLLIIDCLSSSSSSSSNNDTCACDEPTSACQNVHSEVKLGAPISDIANYQDRLVFVALGNGQLAVFSRQFSDNQYHQDDDHWRWSLSSPQILTITQNELNLTSKVCLVDAHLWYSYGRYIFVLDIETLKLVNTIMTPANDKLIQFQVAQMGAMVSIDGMELVRGHEARPVGVWVSFKGSPLLQLYDCRGFKLMKEISLMEPLDRVLSYGNEIIRQHKTACLGATSLLNIYNQHDHSNSLFVGTSAGIIIYLRLDQLEETLSESGNATADSLLLQAQAQMISLRHGHSGQVKFLRLIELQDDLQHEQLLDNNSGQDEMKATRRRASTPATTTTMCLISGGAGIDLYGPSPPTAQQQQQQQQQQLADDDCLNQLIMWQF